MRIQCKHGFFIFRESKVGEISDFMSLTGLSLAPREDYYTFETLQNAPDYSLIGKPLVGGAVAIKTFQGAPWEVFEANGLVYDFTLDLVVPIATIIAKTKVKLAGNYFVSPGLILPGSLTDEGRVKDYAAWYLNTRASWLYSGVEYV